MSDSSGKLLLMTAVSVGLSILRMSLMSRAPPGMRRPTPNTTRMATRVDGTAFVILGRNTMMAIVRAMRPTMMESCGIFIQPRMTSPSLVPVLFWKKSPWPMAIMIASPLTNPIMTGCGMSLTSFPSLQSPKMIWMIPAMRRAATRYCIPI